MKIINNKIKIINNNHILLIQHNFIDILSNLLKWIGHFKFASQSIKEDFYKFGIQLL